MMSCLVQIPFVTFIRIVTFLPLFSFIFCIAWSILFDYEEVTRTHCHVLNFLPSVSTAIGTFSPQKYIWRISIALHCTPRFLISLMYYNFYVKSYPLDSPWQRAIFTCYLLQNIEILSLVGLTYVSSTEDFPVHQKLFVSFVLCALLSMLFLLLIIKNAVKELPSRLRRKSIRFKLILLCLNLAAFCASMYFYFRHNWYCEAGLYSLFAIAEYVVVLSNMGYHYTAVYDFFSNYVIVDSLGTIF